MAFEPGGYADKLGNRYEGRWVTAQLLRLLREDLRSVTLEGIGDDEEGVDLWVEDRKGIREAQQCKARNRGDKNWSVADLHSRGILAYTRRQLDRNANYQYALITGVPSPVFQDICQSARDSNENSEDFYRYQIKGVGEERHKVFQQYCSYLGLDPDKPSDRANAFGYLQRTHIYLKSDDHNSRNDLLDMASMLIAGKPEMTVSLLSDFAQDNLRKTLDSRIILDYLASQEFYPRQLAHDTRVWPAVEALQKEFQDSIKPFLVANELIPRVETELLLQAVKKHEITILHGIAGSGKSGVLYEFTQLLKELGHVYLPVRLDRREPRNNPKQFGEELGLPESPSLCLQELTAGRPGILILDQLDALRWTSSHSTNALNVCKAITGEVRALRRSDAQISLILACRTFDLENDPEIKNWLKNESNCQKIEVKDLSDEKLKLVVERFGYSFSEMTSRQRKILSSPQRLGMWVEIIQSGETPNFQTAMQLIRQFWVSRYRELDRFQISSSQADEVINLLIQYMETNGRIAAPQSIVESHPIALEALESCGVLQTIGGRISFCHQSYLDFRIAIRLLNEIHLKRRTVCDWLGPREHQSLFRREQLRIVLSLLIEESESEFVNNIQRILDSDEVRFHIKHLVLELIGQVEEPSSILCDYLVGILGDNFWKEHLLETAFAGHPPFMRCLIKKGTIAEWIGSGLPGQINEALWLLRLVNDKIPDDVSEILEPFADRDQTWLGSVLGALCIDPTADSDRMFELRLQLARRGIISNFMKWSNLAERYPVRAIMLLEAILSTWNLDNFIEDDNHISNRRPKSRLENWDSETNRAFKEVSSKYPERVWDFLVPHISRLTVGISDRPGREVWLDAGFYRAHDESTGIQKGLVKMAIAAGKSLAQSNPNQLLGRSRPLNTSNSPIVQLILTESYSKLPAEYADEAILWIISDSSHLDLGSGYGEPEWMPAARLIQSLSPYCSDEVFQKLETYIINYHSPYERDRSRKYLLERRNGFFWHYWGHAQYILLPMLCPKRSSDKVNKLINMLKRKFGSYPEREFLRGGNSRGGTVVSPIPNEKLDQISDRAWLKIISRKSRPEGIWRQIDNDHMAVSSVEHFAQDLKFMARKYPDRFGRLALRFQEDCNPAYVNAILDGFSQKDSPSELQEKEKVNWHPATVGTIEAVLNKFPPADDINVIRSFCSLVQDRPNELWSGETFKKIIDYSISYPDPVTGRPNILRDTTSDEVSVKILYQNTMNCVRGLAAKAIEALLWERPELLFKFQQAINHLVEDVNPAVRMASLDTILPVLNINEDCAIGLFLKASENDLRIAASPTAVHFFNKAFQSHFELLAPIVRRMLGSPYEDVVQEGSMEVTARWIFNGFFTEELNICSNGSISQRKGVARIAAHFASHVSYSDKCRDLLLPFFKDSDKAVRDEVQKAFRDNQILQIPNSVAFIKMYIQSQCFIDDPSPLLYTLQDHQGSLIPFAELIFSICNVFSGPLKDQSRDISTHIAADVYQLPPLLLRLYEQAQDQGNRDISNACLDMWDLLFEKRVGMTRELTKAIEQ